MAQWWYSFLCTLHYLIIIIMQAYLNVLKFQNNDQEYILSRVSEITSILLIIFCVIYGAVCFHLTHLSYDECKNTCTLSYYHHQIGSMSHWPLFRVRSWHNGMRCMSVFFIVVFRFFLNHLHDKEYCGTGSWFYINVINTWSCRPFCNTMRHKMDLPMICQRFGSS